MGPRGQAMGPHACAPRTLSTKLSPKLSDLAFVKNAREWLCSSPCHQLFLTLDLLSSFPHSYGPLPYSLSHCLFLGARFCLIVSSFLIY